MNEQILADILNECYLQILHILVCSFGKHIVMYECNFDISFA